MSSGHSILGFHLKTQIVKEIRSKSLSSVTGKTPLVKSRLNLIQHLNLCTMKFLLETQLL